MFSLAHLKKPTSTTEGIVLTLDRGFATQDMVISLLESGATCVSIVTSTSVQGHPFVARSYLNPGRVDDSGDEFGMINDMSVVLWVFAGVHKKHQTHHHKRPSKGNKCLGYLCKEKGEAW